MKVAGLLKKFQSQLYITLICGCLEVLEKIVYNLKIFEGDGLLPCEIKYVVKTLKAYLKELVDDEDNIDSHLHDSSLQIMVASQFFTGV